MSSKPEQRLGWGVPVELNGEQADDVRTLLERLHPSRGTRLYDAWRRLSGLLIPPVEICADNRDGIRAAADYLWNIDSHPDEDDPNYDVHIENLSNILTGMKDCFRNRPPGCEMQTDPETEVFECARCLFHESVRDV